jgi:hypothetical protein
MQQAIDSKQNEELQSVKIGFMRQGTNISRYCQENGINHSHAFRVFSGKWKGKKASALKQRLIDASNSKDEIR